MSKLIEQETEKFIKKLNKTISGKWVILESQDASTIAYHDEDVKIDEIWRRTNERIFQINEVYFDTENSELIVRINTEWGYTYLLLLASLNNTEVFDTKEEAQLVYECRE